MSYLARLVGSGDMLTTRIGPRTHLGYVALLIDLPDGRIVRVEWTGPDTADLQPLSFAFDCREQPS